jgi:hypothetical protein
MSLDPRPFRSALVPLVLVLALPSDRAPRPDEPAFTPRDHAILTKTYTEHTRLEVDSFEVRVDGDPMEQAVPAAELTVTRHVVIGDEYAKVEGGKILDLLRSFEELRGTVAVSVDEGGREEHDVRVSSALEGAIVRFEWDAEREEYARSFEEGGTGDDDHLARLEIDTDLTGFLPSGSVAVGATWSVEPKHLGRVFAPSGDLRLLAADMGDEPYVVLDKEAMFAALQSSLGELGDGWQGEIEARYRGNGEEDGVTVGRIELEIDVTCDGDLLERLERTIDHLGLGTGNTFTGLRLNWAIAGKGELVWDLDSGHARSFWCEGQVEMRAHLAYTQPFLDQEMQIEADYAVSGETRVELGVE